MHPSMNPIEKHKSEIEKRMSQLEQKFNKDRGAEGNGPAKRLREYIADENKIYGHPVAMSKTMEVKGRNRGAGEIARVKKNIVPDPQSNLHLEALQEIKNFRNLQEAEAKQEKEGKIKELEHMVKSLLEGQKVLQKELNELKTKNKEDASRTRTIDQSNQQYEPPISFVSNNNQKPMYRYEQKKDSSICRKRSSVNPMNHSLLIADSNADKAISREKRNPKKHSTTQMKKKDFEQLYQQLKEKNRDEKRYFVEEEWKSRIWNEVESRVRESDKEYKDTMHRNNKHEFQHLMSTFELQRKLKDDLVDKVYQQCNDQIYK